MNAIQFLSNRYNTIQDFERYRQDYIRLYVDVISNIVKEEDPSRAFAVSSPSNGKLSEREGYIAKEPGSSLYGDGNVSFGSDLIVRFQFN